MKIAVSATGATLDSEVDPRFGRAQYFLIVDVDTMQVEAVSNENAMAGGGAGTASAQLVVNKGAQAVLTGNCGPNAFAALAAVNVPVITGVFGKVREAVENYKAGKYQSISQANVADHFGKAPGGGFGAGQMFGGGRGTGGGGGRGRGRGF